MKKTIAVVFGTRPEAIKLSPVIKELEKNMGSRVIKISTGQHKEMLTQVLDLFEIDPDYDLEIMSEDQTLNSITAAIFVKLDALLKEISPSILVVHGDTTTAMSAAVCAFHLKIPIVHVEAGLRSRNIFSPWPEELNRSVISLVAEKNFAPTEEAKLNLVEQGINPLSIHVTGNTVIDALRITRENIEASDWEKKYVDGIFSLIEEKDKIILVTGHRRESFGKGFEQICLALKKIAQIKNVKILYPVHLNPSVKQPVQKHLSNEPNIILMDPVGYEHFVC